MRCLVTVLAILTTIIGSLSVMVMARDFYIDFVEYNKMRMIFTSADHYGIYNPDFKSNWQAFSYNDKNVYILRRENTTETKSWSSLTREDKNQVEESRKALNNIRSSGPSRVSGDVVRVSTYDLYGSVSSAGYGGKSSTSSMSVNGMSVSKFGESDYVISKNDMPFKWVRLFINDKIVCTVNRDGIVLINHIESMTNEERAKLDEIMEPIKKMEGLQNNLMKSINNPIDFVNKAMGSGFGFVG